MDKHKTTLRTVTTHLVGIRDPRGLNIGFMGKSALGREATRCATVMHIAFATAVGKTCQRVNAWQSACALLSSGIDAGTVELQACTQEGHFCSLMVTVSDTMSTAELKAANNSCFREDILEATASSADAKQATK